MKNNPLDAAGGAALLVLVVGIFYGLVKLMAPKGQAEKWVMRIVAGIVVAIGVIAVVWTLVQVMG